MTLVRRYWVPAILAGLFVVTAVAVLLTALLADQLAVIAVASILVSFQVSVGSIFIVRQHRYQFKQTNRLQKSIESLALAESRHDFHRREDAAAFASVSAASHDEHRAALQRLQDESASIKVRLSHLARTGGSTGTSGGSQGRQDFNRALLERLVLKLGSLPSAPTPPQSEGSSQVGDRQAGGSGA